MSDTSTIDPESPSGEVLDPNIRDQLRRLDEIKAERDAAQRDLAFARAGVPSDDPRATYFVKGYDGEIDPVAIKAAWDTAFAPTPTETAEPAPDLSAAARIAQASAGSQGAGSVLLEDALAAATTEQEVMDIVNAAPRDAFRVT